MGVDVWGKDHWSTLGYVECRIVDNGGFLDPRHLRRDGNAYPTRLRGAEMPGHTDLDCIADIERHGLLTYKRKARTAHRNLAHLDGGAATWHVTLTELGRQVCADLRVHKQGGGNFAGFQPNPRHVAAMKAEASKAPEAVA